MRNTSFPKITKVKQLEPRLARGWVTIQGFNRDTTNAVKSQGKMNSKIILPRSLQMFNCPI